MHVGRPDLGAVDVKGVLERRGVVENYRGKLAPERDRLRALNRSPIGHPERDPPLPLSGCLLCSLLGRLNLFGIVES